MPIFKGMGNPTGNQDDGATDAEERQEDRDRLMRKRFERRRIAIAEARKTWQRTSNRDELTRRQQAAWDDKSGQWLLATYAGLIKHAVDKLWERQYDASPRNSTYNEMLSAANLRVSEKIMAANFFEDFAKRAEAYNLQKSKSDHPVIQLRKYVPAIASREAKKVLARINDDERSQDREWREAKADQPTLVRTFWHGISCKAVISPAILTLPAAEIERIMQAMTVIAGLVENKNLDPTSSAVCGAVIMHKRYLCGNCSAYLEGRSKWSGRWAVSDSEPKSDGSQVSDEEYRDYWQNQHGKSVEVSRGVNEFWQQEDLEHELRVAWSGEERQVVLMLYDGNSQRQIADKLHISIRKVAKIVTTFHVVYDIPICRPSRSQPRGSVRIFLPDVPDRCPHWARIGLKKCPLPWLIPLALGISPRAWAAEPKRCYKRKGGWLYRLSSGEYLTAEGEWTKKRADAARCETQGELLELLGESTSKPIVTRPEDILPRPAQRRFAA